MLINAIPYHIEHMPRDWGRHSYTYPKQMVVSYLLLVSLVGSFNFFWFVGVFLCSPFLFLFFKRRRYVTFVSLDDMSKKYRQKRKLEEKDNHMMFFRLILSYLILSTRS